MCWLLDILRGVQRYIYDGNNRNPTPDVSAQEEPARTSPPTQPETTPVRVAAQTPPPSVSQRNSVDSVRPPTISNPPEKPEPPTISPETTPARFTTQTASPSASQSYSVDSVRSPTISNPPEKPSNGRSPINAFFDTYATPSNERSPNVLYTYANGRSRFNVAFDNDGNSIFDRRIPPESKIRRPVNVLQLLKNGESKIRRPVNVLQLLKKGESGIHTRSFSSERERNRDPWAKPLRLRTPTNVLPVYHIPGDIKHVIEKDQVPEVLKKCLSTSNYADYFAALLYAEDYYMEKWKEVLKEYVLSGINLRLREETISGKSRKSKETVYMNQMGRLESNKEEEKVYVEFDMDSIPERRPFLLAKDYVYVRRSGETVKPFQGFILRVEKGKLLLAEFGKDFHAQHSLTNKYDVWFDFNRVCLKRSHQGVAAAVDPSFRGILFPERVSRSRRQNRDFDQVEMSAVNQILSLKGPPPYLIVESSPPRSHEIIVEAILQIYRTFMESRILIVAPQNRTCDLLMRLLKKQIPDSEIFRANAAFRERDEVPEDVLSSSLYEGECFTCPPSEDLRQFKVIASTFMSSFRLLCHGINAGHFSHIFVVDACYATEPETMVTLANLANESTAVVLTGSSEHYVTWVRSNIARENGLRRSYFKRLLESEPYKSRDPGFVNYL